MANPEEKDSVEPTSSDAPSTPAELADTWVGTDEARVDGITDGPSEQDPAAASRYELGAEADEDPIEPEDLTAKGLTGPEADESNGELVAVGAPTDRTIAKKSRGSGRVEKKGKATPKQRPSARPGGRTTPATFVKESVGELRKVVYPTGQQLANYFVVVLIFVLFIIAIVSLLDLAFGWAILKVFS